MFFNKKGDSKAIQGIILVLIFAVIAFLWVPQILESGERGSDIISCRNWAVLQSAVKDPVVGTKLVDLNCPCVTLKDELKGNKFDVYETLANGMHDVWNMYGKGKVDFFSNLDWFKKNTYCFIGDEISINEEKLKIDKINIDKFEEHLSNYYPPKSENTYAEFLTGAPNTKLDFGLGNIELKKDEKIYILFTVMKKNDAETKRQIGEVGVATAGGCIAGGYAGAKAGAGVGFVAGLFSGPGAFLTTGTGALFGAGGGCIMGMVSAAITYHSAYADGLYPGLILISGEDIPSLEKKCDAGIHYKPKEGIFKK